METLTLPSHIKELRSIPIIDESANGILDNSGNQIITELYERDLIMASIINDILETSLIETTINKPSKIETVLVQKSKIETTLVTKSAIAKSEVFT